MNSEEKERLKQILKTIKTTPLNQLLSYLKTQNFNDVYNIKTTLDHYYYNKSSSLVEDDKYDIIKDFVVSLKPSEAKVVGSSLREGENRVELPFWMGSADKITPKDSSKLRSWLINNISNSYIISEKLDGVSCLLVHKNKQLSLYTRGDGLIGADISYLSNTIRNIPKLKNDIAVRGELVLSKKDFNSIFKDKVINGKEYKNARNTVSGLVGSKTAREGLSAIQFVAYEIVSEAKSDQPEFQLDFLDKLGFKTVKHEMIQEVTMLNLENFLTRYKSISEFEIDGIIIQSNSKYNRNTEGNPDYMFAFKMLFVDDIRTTTISRIEWQISKQSKLTPVAIFDPVEINGAIIRKATALHGKFVFENNLGPGSKIEIIRSNEVIPKIHKIIKSTFAQMPNVPYKWDDNKVFIYATDSSSDNSSCVKLLSGFFNKIGVKNVAEGTINKLFDAGYNNLFKILDAKQSELRSISGFQDRLAEIVVENIKSALKKLTIPKLIGSSSILGYGIAEKKVEALFDAIPNILEIHDKIEKSRLQAMISSISGFGPETINKIIPNLKYASLFVLKMSTYTSLFEKRESKSDLLMGKSFVFSGFRDKELEEAILRNGGKVTSTVTKNTSILLVKSSDDDTTKTKNAIKFNIPIILKSIFERNNNLL